MDFKKWIEHYGGSYPEPGDFIMVKEPVRAGSSSGTLPAGTYLVLSNNEEEEKYTVKNKTTQNEYEIYWDDLDEMIKSGNVTAD